MIGRAGRELELLVIRWKQDSAGSAESLLAINEWSSGTLDHWNWPSVSAAQVWRLCVSWTEVMVDFWSDVSAALLLVCLFFGSVDAYAEIHEYKMWIFCCWRRSENSNNNSLRFLFVMKLKYSWSLGLETGWFAVNGTSFFLVVISAVDAATDICLYFILLIMPPSGLLW